MFSVAHIRPIYWMTEWLANNRLERIWKEMIMTKFTVESQDIYMEGLRKLKKVSISIASLHVKTWILFQKKYKPEGQRSIIQGAGLTEMKLEWLQTTFETVKVFIKLWHEFIWCCAPWKPLFHYLQDLISRICKNNCKQKEYPVRYLQHLVMIHETETCSGWIKTD
jgi:hypothetical protein